MDGLLATRVEPTTARSVGTAALHAQAHSHPCQKQLLAVERREVGASTSGPPPMRKGASSSPIVRKGAAPPKLGEAIRWLGGPSGSQLSSGSAGSFWSEEDQQTVRGIIYKATKGGITPLMLACRQDDAGDALACVRVLLVAKAEPTRASEENKLTALHVAAESSPPRL